MKQVLTEATRKNIVESFQRVANNMRYGIVGVAASYAEIACVTVLDVLYQQEILSPYAHIELMGIYEKMKRLDADDIVPEKIVDDVAEVLEIESGHVTFKPVFCGPADCVTTYTLRYYLSRILRDYILRNKDDATGYAIDTLLDVIEGGRLIDYGRMRAIRQIKRDIDNGRWELDAVKTKNRVIAIMDSESELDFDNEPLKFNAKF